MSTIEEIIGAKITKIRLEQELTQAELAEKVGISLETVSRLERGVTFPSLKTVNKIATVLEVPMKEFFDFDEQESKDRSFERELHKFIAFLRTLTEREINLIHKVSKVAVRILRE